MRRLELRRADTIMPDEGGESRKSFVELVRIAQRTFKQAKLLPRRSRGHGGKTQGNDRMIR